MSINIKIEDIKINMKLVDNPDYSEKAIFTLTFGTLKNKGFRILPSIHPNKNGECNWIAVPAYRSRGGTFHKIFFCEDKELWKKIEEKVWQEYNRLLMMKEVEQDNEIPVIEDG